MLLPLWSNGNKRHGSLDILAAAAETNMVVHIEVENTSMFSSTKARLIVIVLAGAYGPLAGAEALRGPESFSSIADRTERSRALFVEAGRVLQHPRCLNCHPVGERPTQGSDGHPPDIAKPGEHNNFADQIAGRKRAE